MWRIRGMKFSVYWLIHIMHENFNNPADSKPKSKTLQAVNQELRKAL
jgi:hypothetical protein